ncbi:hypothetical protein chiPu_0028037 [Chiloscyllium punctatum]|uniref:Uncharacterized protein n=1 Tax=Chiloscyllium punctatum TaxID=137246 RepID=A0A401TNU1_CHIPU|nr:hypothetical protein [Chiloscyllium punctatum]
MGTMLTAIWLRRSTAPLTNGPAPDGQLDQPLDAEPAFGSHHAAMEPSLTGSWSDQSAVNPYVTDSAPHQSVLSDALIVRT